MHEKIKINNVTLCLTMGGRPDLLRKSLESLKDRYEFAKIIAINDFSDQRCDVVFKEIYPDGLLISDGVKRGHHGAINKLYENIDTEFVFHTEDDWVFTGFIDFKLIQELLLTQQSITSYCFREIRSFLSEEELGTVKQEIFRTLRFNNLSRVHPEWYSFTFNPHITLTQNMRRIGDFKNYKKERHVSRALKKKHQFVAYADPGICVHIGEERSVANPNARKKKSRLRVWIRGKINAFKKAFDSQS